jgi:hypothetical protein
MTDYAWFTDPETGRQVYRRVRQPEPDRRSHLAAPLIKGDTIEPTRSMADGKFYTSKAALRATYKPSGNPKGERYIEVGDQDITKHVKPPEPDAKAIRDAADRALSQVGISA